MMGLGHQQHAANEVCGGHPLGALAFSVPSSLLHFLVGVPAIYGQRDVIAVDAEVTVVLVQSLQCGDVGAAGTTSSTHLMACTILYLSS